MSKADELPWFRLWTDIIDDHKIRLLAFEDRWHFVALMSLKRSGFLDQDQKKPLFMRGLAIKLGVTGVDLENLKNRLIDVELIGEDWCPINWEERQKPSDSAAARMRKHRAKKKREDAEKLKAEAARKAQETEQAEGANVTVTSPLRNSDALDTEEDKDKDKESQSTTALVDCSPPDWFPEIKPEVVWHEFARLRASKKLPITEGALVREIDALQGYPPDARGRILSAMISQGHCRLETYHLQHADALAIPPPGDQKTETYAERVHREHLETLAEIDREREERRLAAGGGGG